MRSLLFWALMSSTAMGGAVDKLLVPEGFLPPARYPIRAYSEYMPAPLLGVRPYESRLDSPAILLKQFSFSEILSPEAQSSFLVSKAEEELEIRPALTHLAQHWLQDLRQLAEGQNPGGSKLPGIAASLLDGNPFYPENLPKDAGPIVSLTSLTLSKTQDDEGKMPWTVYGGMFDEEGNFWKSLPRGKGAEWLGEFLTEVFSAKGETLKEMGARVLAREEIPVELRPFAFKPGDEALVRYLITFAPIRDWPAPLRKSFEAGTLKAIPHPLTLVFSGSSLAHKLSKENTQGAELALAREFTEFAGFNGMRVLRVRSLLEDDRWRRRQHRFSKKRNRDGEDWDAPEVSPFQLLFDALPEVIGLYGKPIARNTQIWGVSGGFEGQWLLDGPKANLERIAEARAKIVTDAGKSRFHYREYYPPLQVNGFEVRWYRPLVAWLSPGEKRAVIRHDLTGRISATKGKETVWLTPKPRDLFGIESEAPSDARKILEFSALLNEPLTEELASVLITSKYPAAKEPTGFAQWKKEMAASHPKSVAAAARKVKAGTKTAAVKPLTFPLTVDGNPNYEKEYWQKIAELSAGSFRAKNNVDCAEAEVKDGHCVRNHLPLMAEGHLARFYADLGIKAYDHAFTWELDFPIPWWGGLKEPHKNVIAVIPGTGDHSEAVIMGDHYDTAYMADIYNGDLDKNLTGHRHAAPGADDNHSATAALMEAARVLSKLKLKRDVWLVHLTGEEFPADCLGARALSEALITGREVIAGKPNPKIVGLYVLDMVAHNTDRDHVAKGAFSPSIYQISPGRGERSAHLAQVAHAVTETWNRASGAWDRKFKRKAGWERSKTKSPPKVGEFPRFRGEIRPWWHPRSSLFNTDGQIFSDAGIPAVLFMENYDINRSGYHDTLDTLANIDLDYGAGLTRIAIEAVAQLANE